MGTNLLKKINNLNVNIITSLGIKCEVNIMPLKYFHRVRNRIKIILLGTQTSE